MKLVFVRASILSVRFGPLAQLVERVIRIDEVSGSTPLWSTTSLNIFHFGLLNPYDSILCMRGRKVSKILIKCSRLVFIFLLAFGWVYSGWPQIGNFPPGIEEVQAAAPTFVAASAIGNSTAGTFTVTLPTHATDDILLSISWYRASATVLLPTGWTEAATALRDTTRYYLHWKRATSASETNPVFDYTGANDGFGLIVSYRGVINTGNPYDVLGAFASGTAEPATLTGITTLTANSLVVALIGGEDNTGTGMTMTATDPAAFIEHYAESATGTDGAVAIGEASRATTGATGNVSSAFGATVVGGGGWVLALQQPAAPTVTTQAASSVTATTATLNGNVTATG